MSQTYADSGDSDGVDNVEINQTQASQGGKTQARKNYKWTRAEDEELVYAMKEAKKASLKSPQGFKPGGYSFILEKLQERFPGTAIRIQPHIKNRIRTLKARHTAVLCVKGKSGVEWDDVNKSFNCDDEKWERIVKEFPILKKHKDRKWVHFEDWCEIFGKETATGKRARSFGEAINKLLAGDRVNATDKDLEFGYDLAGDDVAGDDPNVVLKRKAPTRSVIPNIGDGTVLPRAKRNRAGPETDQVFMDMLGGLMKFSQECMESVKPKTEPDTVPTSSESFESRFSAPGVGLMSKLNEELSKFTHLGTSCKVALGRKLVAEPGMVEFFLSMTEEDKWEFVTQEVSLLPRF